MQYIAVINRPGFMPEQEPQSFDTFNDALEYMQVELANRVDLMFTFDEHLELSDIETQQKGAYVDLRETGLAFFDGLAFEIQQNDEGVAKGFEN